MEFVKAGIGIIATFEPSSAVPEPGGVALMLPGLATGPAARLRARPRVTRGA